MKKRKPLNSGADKRLTSLLDLLSHFECIKDGRESVRAEELDHVSVALVEEVLARALVQIVYRGDLGAEAKDELLDVVHGAQTLLRRVAAVARRSVARRHKRGVHHHDDRLGTACARAPFNQ